MKIFIQTIIGLILINISFAQTNYYVYYSLGKDTLVNSRDPGTSAWQTIQYAVNHVSDSSVMNIHNF